MNYQASLEKVIQTEDPSLIKKFGISRLGNDPKTFVGDQINWLNSIHQNGSKGNGFISHNESFSEEDKQVVSDENSFAKLIVHEKKDLEKNIIHTQEKEVTACIMKDGMIIYNQKEKNSSFQKEPKVINDSSAKSSIKYLCRLFTCNGVCLRKECSFAHTENELHVPCRSGNSCLKQHTTCKFKHPLENFDTYVMRMKLSLEK